MRLFYHLGRIGVYGILGLLFGGLGQFLSLAGFQQWLSICAGLTMLILLLMERRGIRMPLWKPSLWVKRQFGSFLKKKSVAAIIILGAANGLLPCGLVYMAGTASVAAGQSIQGAAYMVFFGLGTLPMLLSLHFAGQKLFSKAGSVSFKQIVPIATVLVAFSLILRGMALDIPFLSPASSHGEIRCSACQRSHNQKMIMDGQ